MPSLAKIPVTIVTGFLGAGKTTLIRHLMENAGGRKLALLINEFGDVGVDGGILKGCGVESCPEDAIIELPNGCICCTVADDFLPAMERLLARPGQLDHIIIETSGLALPKPLVKAFEWPAIRSRLTVDGVVAVVDGPAVAAGRFVMDEAAIAKQKAEIGLIDHDNPLAEVYEDQLLCADLILLNKTDAMDDAAKARVKADITRAAPRAVRVVEMSFGQIPADVALGLHAAAENDLANRPSHHDNEEEHDHEDFESIVISLPDIHDPQALHARIAAAAEAHDILRVKGFLRVQGKPMRYLLQAVGSRITGHFDGTPLSGESRLVVIGQKGLDRQDIMDIIGGRSEATTSEQGERSLRDAKAPKALSAN